LDEVTHIIKKVTAEVLDGFLRSDGRQEAIVPRETPPKCRSTTATGQSLDAVYDANFEEWKKEFGIAEGTLAERRGKEVAGVETDDAISRQGGTSMDSLRRELENLLSRKTHVEMLAALSEAEDDGLAGAVVAAWRAAERVGAFPWIAMGLACLGAGHPAPGGRIGCFQEFNMGVWAPSREAATAAVRREAARLYGDPSSKFVVLKLERDHYEAALRSGK
jgi:hypothetical protein